MSYLPTISAVDRIGILGGMGPLASAEFLKTIYEYNIAGECEQKAPQIIVYSDPTFPDRTRALLDGEYSLLLDKLIEALQQLCDLNVTKIIICCITSHYLLPKLPTELRERIICLVDIILTKVIAQKTTCLLLCTTGTRQLKIFSRNPLWEKAQDYILLPNETDQHAVHGMIYQLKTKTLSKQLASHFVQSLMKTYGVDSVIAGCTELHLLSQLSGVTSGSRGINGHRINFLDPLTLLAQDLSSGWSIGESSEILLEAQR